MFWVGNYDDRLRKYIERRKMILDSSAYYGLFLKFVSFFGRQNMMTFVIIV